MECNKEEAIRAKEIAERRMQNGDFDGARRIAKRAQQLYPEIDNIAQLLLVCEVHCSAQNKVNGSETDWYGVLQIERFSEESAIKKQYKRLALSLHPDKNKFAGAESAFKLIGEANRVLTDATKRNSYDMKLRGLVRPVIDKSALHKSSKDSDAKRQNGLASRVTIPPVSKFKTSHTYQQPFQPTFWTYCTSCCMRYQYYRELRNRVLLCQNCKHNFIAQDFGVHGVPAVSSGSQFVNGAHGPSSVSMQNGSAKPGNVSTVDGFTGLDPIHEAKKAVDAGRSPKLEETKTQSAVKPKDVDGEAQNGFSVPKPDAAKSKDSEASKFRDRKRGRKLVPELSANHETDRSECEDDVVAQENSGYAFAQNSATSGAHQPMRSSKQKQHVTDNENVRDDDDFVSPAKKRLRENGISGGPVDEMKECVTGAAAKVEHSGGSAAASADQGKKKIKQKATSNFEESSSNKKSKAVDHKKQGQEVSMSDKYDNNAKVYDGPKLEPNEEPRTLECPDPDFSEFGKDKDEYCFAVNQLWAVYDNVDGMPRFYAWIKKVHSPGLKLLITWLEASLENEDEQDWCDGELPVSCGKFEKGETVYTEDLQMFSHQMHRTSGISRGTYFVYPKKGETWALFKDWDMRWSSEPDKHRPPYQYEIVEIVTDFSKDNGIGVAYLGKVRGFISIFMQTASDGVLSFCIPPGELFRFSHRIPSFRMTGKEGVGVPVGSFELDPASLPSNLFTRGEPGDVEMKNVDIGASCLDSKPTNNEVKSPMCTEKMCTPKKNKNDPIRGISILRRSPRGCNSPHKNRAQTDADQCGEENVENVVNDGNLTRPEGINASSHAGERIKTPQKWRKGELVAESLQPRRSLRDFCKKSSNVNGNWSTTVGDTDNFQDSRKDESCGRMDSPVKDGSSTGLTKSRLGSGRMAFELTMHDFQKEKSIENFQLDQIWALYSDKDGMPRNYAQVKKIESAPHFRLHVAMLESCSPPKYATRFVCCGTFRVKNGRKKVLSLAEFSHQLKPETTGKNRFQIYPRKGEVWAMYKNWNSESTFAGQGHVEFDMVEVLEDVNQSVKVVILMRIDVSKPLYRASRSGRTKAGVMDIPPSELGRFSHQCCAFLHLGDKDPVLNRIWELDSSSITGNVIMID
uniref:J domain-containing protein n=1 Tax=Rhizophora mucronata TaxID=61149 RepID=A0A2P2IVJ7_RHIMU